MATATLVALAAVVSALATVTLVALAAVVSALATVTLVALAAVVPMAVAVPLGAAVPGLPGPTMPLHVRSVLADVMLAAAARVVSRAGGRPAMRRPLGPLPVAGHPAAAGVACVRRLPAMGSPAARAGRRGIPGLAIGRPVVPIPAAAVTPVGVVAVVAHRVGTAGIAVVAHPVGTAGVAVTAHSVRRGGVPVIAHVAKRPGELVARVDPGSRRQHG
jgi:hypothetical protein